MNAASRISLASGLAASLGAMATPVRAQDVDKSAAERHDTAIYQTFFGSRVGGPTYSATNIPAGTRIQVPEKWWATDTETVQRFLGVAFNKQTDTSLAVVTGQPGAMTMANLQMALQGAPFPRHTRTNYPDLADSFFDIFVTIDMDNFIGGGGIVPPPGFPLQVVNGQVMNVSMPGVQIGLQPFQFTPNGWLNPAPYTGNTIAVIGDIGQTPCLYSNGTLATGLNTASGVPAPAGTLWSEVQDDGSLTCSNTNAGYSCGIASATASFRMADDFTIPAGETWNITKLTVFAYQTGSVANPFSGCSLNIWNGRPGDVGVVSVFGDDTTNRMAATSDAGAYRVFNTTTPAPGTVPGTTRTLRQLDLAAVVTLGPGTYWISVQTSLITPAAHFMPTTTALDNRQAGGAASNARQYQSVSPNPPIWVDAIDAGNPATCADVIQELPFIICGSVATPPPACYANCDQSTGTPLLTANDFVCFINKYANNDSTANCDGSTGNPLLTANDFVCFIGAYANGCS